MVNAIQMLTPTDIYIVNVMNRPMKRRHILTEKEIIFIQGEVP